MIWYKACLVARGFLKIEGVDFSETFAPVEKFTSVEMILSSTTVEDLYLHQMDVKTAFLNGNLEETVNIEQPDGFVEVDIGNLVWRLKKAIYRLRQGLRQWHAKIYEVLVHDIGLTPSNAGECV